MSKHTPGPWTIDPAGVFIRVEDKSQLPIARIDKRALDKRESANARLIAAAPDMLAALKNAVCQLFSDGHDTRVFEAVIAKAEGRE